MNIDMIVDVAIGSSITIRHVNTQGGYLLAPSQLSRRK